jgi:hypothetical protein
MTNQRKPYDPNRPKRAGVNNWIYSGKVDKKEFKYSTNGNAVFSCMVVIPAKNEKFTTKVFIKAFKEMAEELNTKIENGSNFWFSGYISNSSFNKDGKTVYRTDYIVTRYETALEPEWLSETTEAVEAATVVTEASSSDVPF